MEGDQRIGVSIGCWLPWPVVIPVIGLKVAAGWTKQIGGSFWQMLPLRGATKRALERAWFPIKYVEPAWNPIALWNQIRGRLSPQGTKAYPKDVIFFPNPDASQARFEMILRVTGALPIYHHLDTARRGALVEVYPGLKMTAVGLAEFAERIKQRPYVIDTKHLQRSGEGGESPLWPWQEALETLLRWTALVHVQPLDGEELRRSFAGERTGLVQILSHLKAWGYDGPFLIEVPPDILGPIYYLNPLRMIRTLRKVRELIEAYI